MKLDLEKHKLLVLLLTVDLVFIVLHVLYTYTGVLESSLYSLLRDRGYSEFFQYTKELWVALLFLLLGIRHRRGLYLVFSLLFLYFLLDDYLMIHEDLGRLLSESFRFQPVLGLRAIDLGELLVSAVFGLLFVVAIILFYILSDRTARRIARHLIVLLVLLAALGVLMDMVEIMVDHAGFARLLVILEDVGEMVVMSVITWFVMRLDLNTHRFPISWLPLNDGGSGAEG